jgi:hypothetical protein
MPFLTFRNDDLQRSGPNIEVSIVPPQPVAEQLQKEGKDVPGFRANALIDTGASSSCISQVIVDSLNLIPFDVQIVHTPSGQSEQLFYDAGIVLPISQPNIISVQTPCSNFQTPCSNLSKQPFQVLIGRDVLAHCTFFYNGLDNSFVLHY